MHQKPELDVTISQGGYLYIWLSNESSATFDVYFDDFRITHNKGSILQEDHYYPFGMNISALSSTAPLAKPNKYKYNGNEEQLDFNWNIYDFNARLYDAQIGRFGAVDPLASKMSDINPYHFTHNNPVLFNDPTGLEDQMSIFQRAKNLAILQGGVLYVAEQSESDCKPGEPCSKGKKEGFINAPEILVPAAGGGKVVQKVVKNGLRISAWSFLAFFIELLDSHPTSEHASRWSPDEGERLVELENKEAKDALNLPEEQELYDLREKFYARLPRSTGHIQNVSSFKLLHSEELITSADDYSSIRNLSDEQLIRSVTNPTEDDPVTINARTGKVVDGNTRLYELRRRGLNIRVVYYVHFPNLGDHFTDLR